MNPIPDNNDVQSPEREGSYTYRYPHPAVTTDCCIFTFVSGELAILLVRRGLEPYRGVWALPGGFLRINETAEQCARRELLEETGYGAERITQFHTYSDVDRDPRERVITIAYYAIVKWANVVGGDDADEACWFTLNNLPRLAFDHQRIIADALKAMKRDIYFEPLGYDLLPPEFSMSDLQRVYESIMQTAFDRRNFYNKMRNTGMVIEVKDEKCAKPKTVRVSPGPQKAYEYDYDDLDFSALDGGDSMCSDMGAGDCCAPQCAYSPELPRLGDIAADDADFMLADEDDVVEAKPSRRKNVKYRFNISKFTDLFKKKDEPFKL